MIVPGSSSAKKEEPMVDDLDNEEDPYAGYEEKEEKTRAADLYLDTVSSILALHLISCP